VSKAIAHNARYSSYYYVLAGLYRRLGKEAESREALDVFKRLERETNQLEKLRREHRKNAAAPGASA
jgi:hypothetical protein